MRISPWTGAAIGGLVFFLGGYFVGGIRPQLGDQRVVAKINGEPVSMRQLDEALTAYRVLAFENLANERLIGQYARNQGVKLDSSELSTKGLRLVDSDERARVLNQKRAEALLRKVILRTFSEADKRKYLDIFKEDLTKFSLTMFCLADPKDMDAFKRELAGGTSFDNLAVKYGKDIPGLDQIKLEAFTLTRIRAYFGPYAAKAVLQLKPGQIDSDIPSPSGPLVIRLDKIVDNYADLEKDIDDMLVESQRALLSFELSTKAQVEFEFAPISEGSFRPKGKVKGLAAPSASATPLPGIPVPDKEQSQLLPGIPVPTSTPGSEATSGIPKPSPLDQTPLPGIPKPRANDEKPLSVPAPSQTP